MIFAKTKRNEAGFTLIEMLVVVAIVSLLSVVVLNYLGDARAKGRDSKKNQEVDELIKAIELYRDENRGYPYYGDVSILTNPEMYCIGYSDGEECFGFYPSFYDGFVGDDGAGSLNDALDDYIKGPPKSDSPVTNGSYDYKGIVYGCSELGDVCSEYELWWYLEDADTSCARGATKTSGRCRYNSSNSYE